MTAANSESRKRAEALWAEPQWQADEPTAPRHARALAALQRVYATAGPLEADALLDALEDEGLLG